MAGMSIRKHIGIVPEVDTEVENVTRDFFDDV
jgi:hypothetical protein